MKYRPITKEDDGVAETKAHQVKPAPEKTAWDGEGLPPIDTECEYRLVPSKNWFKCQPKMFVGTQGVVIECDVFEGVQYCSFNGPNPIEFRPIQPEQTEEERASAELFELLQVLPIPDCLNKVTKPEIKRLSKIIAGYLISSGYRPKGEGDE